MNWLSKIADEIEERHPKGEVLISSGGSPSGTYHLGHLRELIISDAILLELRKRGRKTKHIYVSDDLDGLRKIPVNIPDDYDKYLGQSLCDIPSPDGKSGSYADYFLNDLKTAAKALGMEIEFIQSYKKYREGYFAPAIEKALEHSESIRKILENISGHKLGKEWSPIQINEDGYLKKRQFVGINSHDKKESYLDKDGKTKEISYAKGDVKLDWRIDWPARWWLMGVNAEPFGRDHATKGGSFDTGFALAEQVFETPPPLPVPYDFVNLTGDTKKMSASKGTGVDALTVIKVLPPEIIRFFMLRSAPSKRLYFDPENGVSPLIDEFAELMEEQPDDSVLFFARSTVDPIISRIPFSHLVASYQAALKDAKKTLEILSRTGYEKLVKQNPVILEQELAYIDNWLQNWAPEDVKFELAQKVDKTHHDDVEKKLFTALASKIEKAPKNADGELFHQAIYDAKGDLQPKEAFQALYKLLINKESGPRAGWFLSILPREWLLKRLRLEE